MSSSLITENFYEAISDTDVADLNLEDVEDALNLPSYAEAAARGTLPDRSNHNDVDGGEHGSEHRAREGLYTYGQYHILSEFEWDNFHPLNVTPDRPCTAFFKVSEIYTAKQLFDSFSRIGIPASAVRCLHRKPKGEVIVTSSNADYHALFLQHSPLIQRHRYATHPDSDPPVFLTIYDAPYELPDSPIEHRLQPYCKIYSRRRGRLQGYPDTCNGLRHYRTSLH